MPSTRSALLFAVSLLLAVPVVLAAPVHAADFTLAFGTLPSAQGWTYTTAGSPTATEAVAFSVAGNVLTLNTMAFGFTGSGTSAYYLRTGVVNNFEPIVIQVRARVLQYEGDFSNAFVGGGFTFGFTQGTTHYQMGITTNQIRNVGGTILSAAYDNTQFHVYRLEWTPPSSVRYYVDNTLISSNNAGLALAQNRILIGDGTGAANSHTEITSYSFHQGTVLPVEPATWGRIKSLFE